MRAPRAILFDHIPKCAGTSLADHLVARCAGRPILRLDGSAQDEATRAFAALSQATRHGYALLAGHGAFRLAPFAAPDALRITVLRDPVERIASLHRYLLKTPAHYLHREVVRDLPTLAAFATTHPTLEIRNFVTWHYTGLPPAEIDRDPEPAARQAFAVLRDGFDLVGFTEAIDAFVARLDARAGFADADDARDAHPRGILARLRHAFGALASNATRPSRANPRLTHTNASLVGGDREPIPADARAAIEQRNAADLALHALLLTPDGTAGGSPRAEIVRPTRRLAGP
ncbi:MAG: hypothetical protein RIS86_1104 [Planctomycetota bacterium]